MNGEAEQSTTRTTTRKPRPEIQIYRPGMLRQGGSTKSLASSQSSTTTNDERPPRPEKLTTTTSSSRRRSNDTDSVTSRGGSGSTTPDAQAINGRNRFDRGGGGGRNDTPSNYNSTQSLYDTRQQGGYTDYGRANNHRNNRQKHPHQQQFERPGNYNSRGFNERASMRGDGAIARRPQANRRQRNDSINSTQSEMPQASTQLHIDTSFDSASQCGASSMNSLGEAFSFEEMCQNLQSFASMDWSKEVENEFAMQKEMEEEEQRLREQQKASPRRNKRNGRRNHDESDRESSFGGSIAEEAEEEAEEELRSGERTPTSTRSGQSYNPRAMYQRSRQNDENHHGRRQKSEKAEKPRRYRGEHDDRDEETTEYSLESHMTSGRLAGRITIVPRAQNVQNVTQVDGAANSEFFDLENGFLAEKAF
uniref:Uncharacterized protein n=1 Tax=Caenorhabditis tropicalis TaxID=1561998 RepID=A0A1I7ULF9_9PELO